MSHPPIPEDSSLARMRRENVAEPVVKELIKATGRSADQVRKGAEALIEALKNPDEEPRRYGPIDPDAFTAPDRVPLFAELNWGPERDQFGMPKSSNARRLGLEEWLSFPPIVGHHARNEDAPDHYDPGTVVPDEGRPSISAPVPYAGMIGSMVGQTGTYSVEAGPDGTSVIKFEKGEFLTPLEHEAMKLSGSLANKIKKTIDAAPDRDESLAAHDWNEAAQLIHGVQNFILSQAAARAYPGDYRLAGQGVKK